MPCLLDPLHRRTNCLPAAPGAVRMSHELPREADRLTAVHDHRVSSVLALPGPRPLVPTRNVVDPEIPSRGIGARNQTRCVEVISLDPNRFVELVLEAEDHAPAIPLPNRARDGYPTPNRRGARHHASDDNGADHGPDSARDQHGPSAAPAELVAVAPCGEFLADGIADPDEHEAFFQLCEADVVGRDPRTCVPEGAFAGFDRLPARLQRGEVPALAAPAHDPQPSLRPVKGEAAPDRELLDGFVPVEVALAEDAGRVHFRRSSGRSSSDSRGRRRDACVPPR